MYFVMNERSHELVPTGRGSGTLLFDDQKWAIEAAKNAAEEHPGERFLVLKVIGDARAGGAVFTLAPSPNPFDPRQGVHLVPVCQTTSGG